MKIREAIERIDSQKHNVYSQNDKIAWLSRLDYLVKTLIIDAHEGAETVEFTGYNDRTDMETELLVPIPYDEVYLRWLEAQIDYYNGEYGRYNNSMLAFDAVWNNFINDYRKTHVPKARGGSRFVF